MNFASVWLRLLSGFWMIHGIISADQWFVSRLSGTSASNCGLQQSLPCKFIYQIAARARSGDVINVDGSGTSRDPYPCQSTEKGFHTAGLLIRSYGRRAFVACQNNSLQFSCNVSNKYRGGVSLAGITFQNTSLRLVDCSLKMIGVNFVNGSVDALSLRFAQGSPGKIEFAGCIFQNNSANGIKIVGNLVYLYIHNSTFTGNNLHRTDSRLLSLSPLSERAQINVNIRNIILTNNKCQVCFNFGSETNGNLTMEIEKGEFENNRAEESILVVNGDAFIELKSIWFARNAARTVNIRNGKKLEFKITDANFADNIAPTSKWVDGGAVSVGGFTQEAVIVMSRSNFSSNGGGSGGACAFKSIAWLILNVESCHFVQNEAWGSGGALAIGTNYTWQDIYMATIIVQNSNFSGNNVYLLLLGGSQDSGVIYDQDTGGGGALSLYVFHTLNLTFTNNTFADNRAQEKNGGAIRANIRTLHSEAVFLSCEFVRNRGFGTLDLRLSEPLTPLQPRVTIRNSTFSQNSADSINSITYDIFLNQAYLLISFCKFQHNSGGGIFLGVFSGTCDVHVENCLIANNTNFAFVVSDERCSGARFKFTNVSMVQNNCKAKGAVFHVSMNHNESSLQLQSSKFEDNFCLSGVAQVNVAHYTYPDLIVLNSRAEVTINDTVFRGNSGVSGSTLTVLDCTLVSIENSNFTNNFGGVDGSHLVVQMRSSQLKFFKTVFYQTEKSQVFNRKQERPYNGFLTVTSFGNVSMRETSFISNPFSFDGNPLIFVKGASKVSMDDSVLVQSSFGRKLYLHNFSHWESLKTAGGGFIENWITSFSMISWPCPVGTYSIKRGVIKGLTVVNTFNCLECPNGANCTSALAARPNFWGYPIGEKVHFTLCPYGYCCPAVNGTCPYHNASYLYSGCQGNRTGILCGKCKKNFSETLFNNNCLPHKYCTNGWYLVFVVICVLLFALYLIQKPPLFLMLKANLTWLIPKNEEKDREDLGRIQNKTNGRSNFSSDGFLKILFYFYQIAGLLTVSSYGIRSLLTNKVVLPLTSLMDFKLYTNNNWDICPFPGITPLMKSLFPLAIVMCVHLSILIIYLLHSGLNKLRKRTPIFPAGGHYLAAILETQLLGYSATTSTAMRLLHCKQIQNVSRWYYNAEVTCFQWWQIASIVTIGLHSFPFIFALYVGSLQLYRRQISARKFLLGITFPLPYLFLVFVLYLNKVFKQLQDSQEMTSTLSSADLQEDGVDSSPCTLEDSVLEVLSAPFHGSKPNKGDPGKIYWESVLIGRRFILILIGSFVAHAFLRSVLLAAMCLIFLLHHLSQNPFVRFRANFAETVSLATLVLIAILNVGVASYYSEGMEAADVRHKYVLAFRLTEAVLLIFIPFACVILVSLALVSLLVRSLIQGVRWLVNQSHRYKSKQKSAGQDEPLLPPQTNFTTKSSYM